MFKLDLPETWDKLIFPGWGYVTSNSQEDVASAPLAYALNQMGIETQQLCGGHPYRKMEERGFPLMMYRTGRKDRKLKRIMRKINSLWTITDYGDFFHPIDGFPLDHGLTSILHPDSEARGLEKTQGNIILTQIEDIELAIAIMQNFWRKNNAAIKMMLDFKKDYVNRLKLS